jgi:repressor LexA
MAKKSNEDLPLPLSPKEKNVLEFLETYIRESGISPTYHEICKHFSFASFNSVQRYLKQLESKGYIKLPWANQKRAITILRASATLQQLQLSQNVAPALVRTTESLTLPLLGRVAAGAPIEAFEHDEFVDVPTSLVRRPDHTFALRVQGQSMIEDGILDGDLILVQRQSTAKNGEIVIATIANTEEATVKRLYLHSNKLQPSVELRPANSKMTSLWFEPEQVQIRGTVVGLIRKF